MATYSPLGVSNFLPPGSGILNAINNIRAKALGAGLQPSSAAQLQLQSNAANYISEAKNFTTQPGAIWRPPIWNQVAKWNMTVPLSSQNVSQQQITSAGDSGAVGPIVYVFDAILRSDQEEGVRMTELPVQTGGNISDNAYLLQNRVVLEIGMSDAMDSFTPGQWSGNASKSVNAYNILANLKDAKQFVVLTTRVKTYSSMLIERITMSDTAATAYGLRASVRFRQVFVASVTVSQLNVPSGANAISARPQTTNFNQDGTVGTGTISTAIVNQNMVTAQVLANLQSGGTQTNIPGSGVWSSTPTVAIANNLGDAQ